MTEVTDALNQSALIRYDGNGNPLSVTLPNQGVITASYDARNRRITRTDALNQGESWTYDGMGNVLTHTDRKGQVIDFSYDALDRGSLVAYPDGSGLQAGYDAGNRLTRLTDSVVGTISWSYDGLDRMTSEVSGQGGISYSYDAASRRISMTPAAQAVVNYGYDDANRLTSLGQGGESVQLTYDEDGRRIALTLPNGITVKYGYDNASQLASLSYAQANGTNLGNLIYGYDIGGRRVSKSGTFATDALPTPTIQPSSLDLNSRRTNFNGQVLSYDANGNMTSDGTNTYSWNARNQLTQISQGGVAQLSYSYDALGRRISKTILAGTPTQYLYDGANAVQETQGGLVNPILTGLGTDERFARNDVTGRTYFLVDALGSTIGLTDPTGALREQYSYDPYGNVTSSDMTTGFTNPYQYAGREADTAALYYYRARYYSPVMGGFISEDPLGLSGGQASFYSYVDGDPAEYGDPAGLAKWRWSGKGDITVCSYYEAMYKVTKCPYYSAGFKICRGESPYVNGMMAVGLVNGWMSNNFDTSQADMYDAVRNGLIAMDRAYRKKDKLGCYGCLKGHEIDEYHNYVFMEVGLGSSFYGGNWWWHDAYPNPVPDD